MSTILGCNSSTRTKIQKSRFQSSVLPNNNLVYEYRFPLFTGSINVNFSTLVSINRHFSKSSWLNSELYSTLFEYSVYISHIYRYIYILEYINPNVIPTMNTYQY